MLVRSRHRQSRMQASCRCRLLTLLIRARNPPSCLSGRGLNSCYHLISQTTHIACLIEYDHSIACVILSMMILSCYNVHPPSRPTKTPDFSCAVTFPTPHRFHSAMKLRDVFMKKFPRASHLPAAFCPFPDSLLVLFNACHIIL